MLATSHRSPRNLDLADPAPQDAGTVPAPEFPNAPVEASILAGAFSEFIAAAGRLELSYSELQAQVADLGIELAERNAALNQSLAQNERMRAALEQIVGSMPCGVLVLEDTGALSMINPEGMRLLNLEPAPGSGLTLGAISTATGIDLVSFVEEQRGGEGEQEFSMAADGGKRWIEARIRRLYSGAADRSSQSLAHQTILILRDVTAHKQAEQERERGRRATALAEIAAILAHEIRNPLASLELFAGLIAESEALAASHGSELVWVAHMRAGIRSLSGTVNNVLSFTGAGFPAFAPINLAAALESGVEFVRPIAEQAGVALTFQSTGPDCRALGNAAALQQLVLNMVANAVRHTPRGGQVQVSLGPAPGRPGRVLLEFADNGSGIRTEHLAEIFRPGFSGSGNSSGLGLAVCAGIARQHEGTIRVSSSPGLGTTFSVELPTL